MATSRIGRLITRSVVGLQCSSMFKHSQKTCCGSLLWPTIDNQREEKLSPTRPILFHLATTEMVVETARQRWPGVAWTGNVSVCVSCHVDMNINHRDTITSVSSKPKIPKWKFHKNNLTCVNMSHANIPKNYRQKRHVHSFPTSRCTNQKSGHLLRKG